MAEAQKNTESNHNKPKNWKLIGILIFLILNVSVLLTAAFAIYKSTIGFEPPMILENELRALAEQREAAIKEGADGKKALARQPSSVELPSFDELMIPIEPIVANLDGEPRRMVKAVVQFKVLDDLSYTEIKDPNRLPIIRDALLRTLQSTQYSEIESLQGKLFLKDRMLKAVNSHLDEGVVREIYFTELVAQ
jgi:flagellar FliL protein